MTVVVRRAVLAGFSVVLLAASGSAGATTSAAPRCADRNLDVSVFRSAVAAGNVGGYVAFTNRARHACRLSGWPTVVWITAGGRSTKARRVWSTMFGPYRVRRVPVVVLRSGMRADAVFAGSDVPRVGESSCTAYRHLRVTAPGGSRSVLLSAWLRYLDAFMPSCAGISVTMIVPASALYRG